ncbi:methyltransferase type 11 [Pochonia chlamydosporia 170]|uniref:Methyltransferase type 11 n=1 Tax=Pochonia chlamydosporia 170 TaxID=1380566 RepID=A0A179F6L2_METCM|nr:methyltransferase type 11 [Pochonia chlamydosporia 170]OAQ61094.1 methyltransferase type 11 [Pochonia chlamydosporia 170]
MAPLVPSKKSTPEKPQRPVINDNPGLQNLYKSFESRLGYWLLLGNTRHFGYWDKDTYLMFPLNKALRRMEEKLYRVLGVTAPGAKVLDAGCGVAHVALYMANHGLQVTGIDVMDHHLDKARRNIARAGPVGARVSVQKMDYHHLETLEAGSFDGVYTMETFVHATDPLQVLEGFHRLLRPGGRLAMHEYDHDYESDQVIGKTLAKLMREVSEYGAMPTWKRAKRGFYREILEEAGFVDIQEHDYSENVRPMLRLFWLLAAIPYYIIVFFHLERYFVNAIGGARGYYAQKYWRYLAISARKPDVGEGVRHEEFLLSEKQC